MSEDMFQAMAFGSILHRTGRGRAEEGGVSPSPQEVLDTVTVNAAASVGAAGEVGALAAGMKADLTVLDLRALAMTPVINPISNIVHYGHPGIVHSVLCDGAWLMRDRRLTTIDEDDIVRRAAEATERVWARMLDANPDLRRH
jgi:5-methylthioadenosine/S-adenosylhomocysteine deaminase